MVVEPTSGFRVERANKRKCAQNRELAPVIGQPYCQRNNAALLAAQPILIARDLSGIQADVVFLDRMRSAFP
jgi:hypothetical protein